MATLFTESFETDGNGTRYSTSIPEFSDGSGDFFTRTDSGNISGGYEVNGIDGSFYFAAQDIDGEGAASQQTLEFSGIDVSGFTNLGFNALFAEDDASDGNEDWDAPDFVTVEYQIDDGGFNNLLAFANDGSTFNSAPLQDTDFDGTGEGTEVTDTFATFANAIAQTGSTLDLRFTFDLNSGDEDLAIDAIEITGDANDNSETTVAIAATDANKAEGNDGTTPFTFTVTRSVDTSGETSVDFAVSGDIDAADFGGTLPSGTVNFASGETSQVITLDVSGDNDSEPDESFTVTLSNASSATISTETADGSIQNDDGNDAVLTPIFDIQGTALTSPLEGETVTTSGIVTAVDSRGFYLQDAAGDGDNATSDGIFVFTNSAPSVSVGDELEVAGTVSEFTPGGADTGNLSITQISSPEITTVSSENALPDAVIIGQDGRVPPDTSIDDNPDRYNPDADGLDFFESLEGMLVTAQDAEAVSGTTRFGEIFTVVNGGASATGLSDRGTLNISPDDFNPEKVQIDENFDILPGFNFPSVDTGANLGDVTGVVGYSFGNFEIYPTQPFDVAESSLSAEITNIQSGEDELTVASYNVLNLDPNDSDGDTDIANGRYEAVANDIVTNLNTPDIIGLQEIQDNSGSADDGTIAADANLQRLVDAIAANGGPQYEFIDNIFIENNSSGGQPGGNIRTAFLYDPSRVDLVEGSVEPIGNQDSGSPFNGARLPLVADFEFNGQEVTVVNNHFSSKGGSSPIFGVDQPFEELQENPDVNGSLDERQAQAQAVNDYLEGILTDDADANIAVLGDLNEFEFISPVDEILGSDLTNSIDTIPEDERYSFIFQGNSQELDHILVSDALVDGAAIDIVHVNSEFAETEQRASDHDPILAQLVIESVEPPEPVNEINGTRGDDNLRGTSGNDFISGNNGNDTLNGSLGNDTIEGDRGGDNIRGGAGDDVLAADRVDRFDDFDGTDSFLGGDNGNDTIFGGSKNDTIGGGNDNDVLFGKSGDDLIRGGSGDDTLNGGIGNDTLRGQGGNDTADYSDLTFNGVFGTVAGLDMNLSDNDALHSSNNNALTWSDTLTTIENVTGTQRNDRFIGNGQDNVFDGQGEVGRSDRQTEFTAFNGETYSVIADVVEYSGSQSDFSFAGSADNFTVAGSGEGTDTLIDIEFVRFNADSSVVATSDLGFA